MRTYGKLRERIRAFYKTIGNFASALQMSRSALSSKLNGSSAWTQSEIEKVCKLLDIPMTSVCEYFFYD